MIPEPDAMPDAADVRATIVAHYATVAPLLAANFAGVPLVAVYHPQGVLGPAAFVGELHHPVPPSIPTVAVTTVSGAHRFIALEPNAVLWLAHRGAVTLGSWTPTAHDPTRARFARVLLRPHASATQPQLAEALVVTRDAFAAAGMRGVPLLDGNVGAALFIPLDDAPPYVALLPTLAALLASTVARRPDLLALASTAENAARIHVSVISNRVARFSSLPYVLAATPDLGVMVPLRPAEIGVVDNGAWTAANFAQRLAVEGDVFASECAAIGLQRFADVRVPEADPRLFALARLDVADDVRGANIRAALAILEDGKPRSADEILAAAMTRGLLSASTTRKYVYVALTEYIARTRGNGRIPAIVQDADRRFRMNRPADDWPEPQTPLPASRVVPNCEALVAALHATAVGTDPTAFEQAVCDAFAALGFAARHVGGNDAPDGILDAPLGSLGYRVTLECKSSTAGIVSQPNVAEAAHWRDELHANHAFLVGPKFHDEDEFVSELAAHAVVCWTVDDLARALTLGVTPDDVRTLCAPGYASDALGAFIWERDHGRRKRIAFVSEALCRLGWEAQLRTAADADDAPALTEDAAMLLIDADLAARASVAHCTRADVRDAFLWLTTPLVARARLTPDGTGLIIVAPPGTEIEAPTPPDSCRTPEFKQDGP